MGGEYEGRDIEGTVDAPATELKLLLGREMHALPSNLIAMKFVGHKIGRGTNRRQQE